MVGFEGTGRRLWSGPTALGALLLVLCVVLPVTKAWSIGLLLPADESLPPLAIRSHHVTIDVTDAASVTRVEQVFVNHTNRPLEATFFFPVPAGSTVSDFSLWINGKKTKGAVLDEKEARATYQRIVQRTLDPGLVEYIDGKLFSAKIFPVPALGEQKVEIAFAAVLGQESGLRRLTYPLKTGRQTATLLDDFSIVVNLSSRAPLKAIYSPTHQVEVVRRSDHLARVGLEDAGVDLEQDFVLYVGTGEYDIGLSLLTYDGDGKGGEDSYFLAVLTPRFEQTEREHARKAVTFVIDTSGSMTGEKLEQARAALVASLRKLRPVDLFNVVRFSTDVESLFQAPTSATEANVARGLAFANRMEPMGGTAIHEALTAALSVSVPSDTPHYVIFVTDGRPTVGETDAAAILKNVARRVGAARVFSLGVGYDVNAVLLDELAAAHHGTSDYVVPGETIEVKVAALYDRIAFPAVTDVAIDFGTAAVYDIYPRRLPDLFRGGQLVVLGRARDGIPQRLRMTGRIGNGAVVVDFDEAERVDRAVAATAVHDFIPKLWATRKVGYLLSEIRGKGDILELKTEVVRLAKKYGLVTPFTSYLAVDDAEFQNAPQANGGVRRRHIVYEFDDEKLAGQFNKPSNRMAKLKESAGRESVISDNANLAASSGKGAVDTSRETNRLRGASSGDASANLNTRWVDGKLFVREQGVWVEQGVDKQKARKIKVGSKEYFDLVEKKPALRHKLSMDAEVMFEDAGESYQVTY